MPSVLTPEFAEFLGIMFGDGNLTYSKKNRNYRVKIASHKITDNEYVERRLLPLIKKLFGVGAKKFVYHTDNRSECYFYSKAITELLLSRGIVTNKKRDKLVVPKEIFKNDVLFKNFLRGFFDTDGSIFKKYGPYAQIGLRSIDSVFLFQLKMRLESLGFHPSIDDKVAPTNLFIHRQAEISQFFQKIGSSNPKHIVRYKIWKETKSIPKIEEINFSKTFGYVLPFIEGVP